LFKQYIPPQKNIEVRGKATGNPKLIKLLRGGYEPLDKMPYHQK